MARNITLTLGAGLGADLGPNFNLTANVGSVTPSTATKSELTAGKSVSVDDAATQVTVTSTGTCTNGITQTIPCALTTTTTSTTEPPTTTTTTTTEAPTTTTTTTAGINYISYPADKYGCSGGSCGSFIETTEIAFPDTFTVTINKWYVSQSGDGYAYQLTSTTPSAGPGLVMQESTFNNCAAACSV
jgi:hypothetical protein